MRDIDLTGALFDLDGVILDTENIYTEFWAEIEKEFPTGIPNFPIAIKGTTLPTILSNYPTNEIKDEISRRLKNFQANMPYRAFPGAIEFLEELMSRNIPAALVTSSDDQKMSCVFKTIPQLKDKFVTVIDGSMVSNSKPHPEGYLRAAKAINRRPENCFVFEDSLQGLAAGRASGATVVALATTYPRENLEGLADIIIELFSDNTLETLLSL
ncbi:MAG: HAD family phosphatase [Paramuribaculum sp.]|nr:HAD family phosphatase [Paramuribaculum sp.]